MCFIDTASGVQGECRAELARAMLSRSLHSPLHIQMQWQRYYIQKPCFPLPSLSSTFFPLFPDTPRYDTKKSAPKYSILLRGALLVMRLNSLECQKAQAQPNLRTSSCSRLRSLIGMVNATVSFCLSSALL